MRETLEEEVENKANFGTLTLKRRKEDREREKDAKMEQLRKKLKTDDEGNFYEFVKYFNAFINHVGIYIY